MNIKTEELYKGKTLQYNIFKKDRIYTFDQSAEVVVVTQLSESIGDLSFGIDAKSFDLIKKLNEPTITFKEDTNSLVIKDNRGRFTAKTYQKELPIFNLENMTSVSVKLSTLKKARAFTSKVNTRPILTSVKLDENGVVISTDTFSFYRYSNGQEIKPDPRSINIPNTFIDLLSLENKDEEIEINYNEQCLMVKKQNIVYIGRLIVGEFPNLSRVINYHGNQKISFDYERLSELTKFSTSNVGVSKENNAKILIKLENNHLVVKGESLFESDIECDYENEYRLVFDSSLFERLTNVFEQTGNKTISIGIGGEIEPLVLELENEKVIITPIRNTNI